MSADPRVIGQPRGRAAGITPVAVTLALAHAANDAYAAFLPPLLPRIMGKLGISIALAATLAMTLSLAASVLQPVVGYLCDRYGRRWFVALGPLCTGAFLSLMGTAPDFWTLILLLLLGGFGSAAFHPPGASMAARVEEGRGSGLRLSVFSFGGTADYALGPLIAVGLVVTVGLEGMWPAAHLGALGLPAGSPPGTLATVAAGFLNMAMLPPVVVIAQEVLPEGAAATSGIVMGLAWAAGSIGVPGAGILGDFVGARTAALACVPFFLGGTAFALHPALRHHRRPVPSRLEPAGAQAN